MSNRKYFNLLIFSSRQNRTPEFEDFILEWTGPRPDPEGKRQGIPGSSEYFDRPLTSFCVHVDTRYDREKQWCCQCARLPPRSYGKIPVVYVL